MSINKDEYDSFDAYVDALVDRVKELEAIPRDEADGFNKIIAHYQTQVKELEAANKDALEYLQREGTPYINAAIAALQENADE